MPEPRCSKPGCGALAGLCADADCPQLNLTRKQAEEYYAMKDSASDRWRANGSPPCWPSALHALEHSTAPAETGAVMYFRSKADRNAFMDWMCRQEVTR